MEHVPEQPEQEPTTGKVTPPEMLDYQQPGSEPPEGYLPNYMRLANAVAIAGGICLSILGFVGLSIAAVVSDVELASWRYRFALYFMWGAGLVVLEKRMVVRRVRAYALAVGWFVAIPTLLLIAALVYNGLHGRPLGAVLGMLAFTAVPAACSLAHLRYARELRLPHPGSRHV